MSDRCDSMKATSAAEASGLMMMGWNFGRVFVLFSWSFKSSSETPKPSAIAIGDSRKIPFDLPGFIAKQQHAEGRTIIDQHASVAVQHAATRCNDRNLAHAVTLGHRSVLLGVDDLELPEAEQQHADHSHDDVGGHGQPRLRQSIVVAEPVRHENPAREYFSLSASCPSGPAGLNSRHEKNHSVGFELTPTRPESRRKCPFKISSKLGRRKNLPELPNRRRTPAA